MAEIGQRLGRSPATGLRVVEAMCECSARYGPATLVISRWGGSRLRRPNGHVGRPRRSQSNTRMADRDPPYVVGRV
jgi:hypothetical protein